MAMDVRDDALQAPEPSELMVVTDQLPACTANAVAACALAGAVSTQRRSSSTSTSTPLTKTPGRSMKDIESHFRRQFAACSLFL
ncbi:hypothetical protein ACFYO2_36660 [Streptomyces sp. NPDC006602]|uniref:hypothetical protein n=1 Tax=Streptomyces sp. NPDC006602 TaxID=3364751 RepID=UPI0036D0F561